MRQLCWQARTTHLPAPVEREIVFVSANPPERPAVTVPRRAVRRAFGRPILIVTGVLALNPRPVIVTGLPRTATGGWITRRAFVAAPGARPASMSAAAAARSEITTRTPVL